MSRSTNGRRNRGFEPEWNSRRPLAPNCGSGGGNPNGDSWAKKVSHHIERQQEREMIRKEIKELDDTSHLLFSAFSQSYIGKLYTLQFNWLDLLGVV